MKLHEVPSELVRTIAEEATGLMLEFHDRHGYDWADARAAAIAEVVEGLGVPIESAETLYGVEMLSGVEVLERLKRLRAAMEEKKRRGQEQRPDVA